MPRSYTSIFTHIIFSTYERQPLIAPDIHSPLHAYLGGIARNLGSTPVTIGGVNDHVHLLSTLPPTISVADFINKLKANSSKWVHERFWSRRFAWQRGYGAFSVSPSMLERVTRYIDEQEQHHRAVTFRDEFVRFLQEAGVEYDEGYLLT